MTGVSGSGVATLLVCVVIGPICLGAYELYTRQKNGQNGNDKDKDKAATEDTPQQSVTEQLEEKREVVSSVQYLLSLLGYAIGIGNLWRFPFLCGRNGGAAFLVAYFICLFFVSLPAYMIEMVMGQYARKSTIEFFKSVHPVWQGLGWAQAFMLFFVLAYYNVLLGYTCIYTIGSLSDPFPWAPAVGQEGFGGKSSAEYWNQGVLNRFPSDVAGSQGFGPVQWELTVGLLAIWVMVFFATAFGKQVLSKVTWVTVVMPVALLLILLFRAVTLEAANEGVAFYIGKFDGSRLGDIGVWRDACVQILFSLSPGMGTALTMSSFTTKKENVYRTCWIVALCNSAFSFVGGFAIFSIIGNITYKINYQTVTDMLPKITAAFVSYEATYGNTAQLEQAKTTFGFVRMNDPNGNPWGTNSELESMVAYQMRNALGYILAGTGTPAMNDASVMGINMTLAHEQLTLQTLPETARAGPGLAFIAIADGMQTFGDAKHVIAVLFFLTLLTLGLDSTFAWAETWISYVDDFFRYKKIRVGEKKEKPMPKWVSVGIVCVVLFLFGLPFCTRMGNELLDTVDNYVGLMFLLFGVFIEGIIFVGFFGFDRFETALRTACDHPLGPIERAFWKFTTHFTMPVIPCILFFWGFVKDASRPYEGYPDWMQAIGWFLLGVCLVLIPLGAIKGSREGKGILDDLPGAKHAREVDSQTELPRLSDPENGKAASEDGKVANKEADQESGNVANTEEPTVLGATAAA